MLIARLDFFMKFKEMSVLISLTAQSRKNSTYGRPRIFQPMQIVGLIKFWRGCVKKKFSFQICFRSKFLTSEILSHWKCANRHDRCIFSLTTSGSQTFIPKADLKWNKVYISILKKFRAFWSSKKSKKKNHCNFIKLFCNEMILFSIF